MYICKLIYLWCNFTVPKKMLSQKLTRYVRFNYNVVTTSVKSLSICRNSVNTFTKNRYGKFQTFLFQHETVTELT